MVIVKVVLAPALVLAATLVARRWGSVFAGWLVALPLTSAPAAYILMHEQGRTFASHAAHGMLAGTASQVAFAMSYRACASKGAWVSLGVGLLGFSAATSFLAMTTLSLQWTTALVGAVLLVSSAALRREPTRTTARQSRRKPAVWELPLRMVIATCIVVSIAAAAPLIGPRLAGLLSPLPVFAAVLAVFTHLHEGAAEAKESLRGLVFGLIAPAMFFLVLATTVEAAGTSAFILSASAAVLAQGVAVVSLHRFGPRRSLAEK